MATEADGLKIESSFSDKQRDGGSMDGELAMRFFAFGVVCCAWACGFQVESLQAQAPRQFGRPLQRQAGPQRLQEAAEAAETAGGLTGNERFLRDRRRPGQFVGADQATTRFIGSGSIIETGRVRSAVESLPPTPDPAVQINRPVAPAPANVPYPPRLILAFGSDNSEIMPVTRADWSQRQSGESIRAVPSIGIDPGLTEVARRATGMPVEVYVSERTASIRGVVSTPRQKQLAELMLGFEPGISTVVNELTIRAQDLKK